MESWQRLLKRATGGLAALAADGYPLNNWIFGGGTALMVQTSHRRSKDIDIFVPDPQYLTILSPRLAGERIWKTPDYSEDSNFLKLRYAEGEIDFIVSGSVTDRAPETYPFEGADVPMDDPVEIAIKKMYHRAPGLTPRDIFDIAVVARDYEAGLVECLHTVSHNREALRKRMEKIDLDFYAETIDELAIFEEWMDVKATALETTRRIVREIPE